jgi:hypothetical protein
MRRLLQPKADQARLQALVDHKRAAQELAIAQIPELTGFREIGERIGQCKEWVRKRMITHPSKLIIRGRRYFVPKGYAIEFIRYWMK